MAASKTRGPEGTYLVERYWPGVSEDLVAEAQERLGVTADRLRGEGVRIRCLTSILIPKEESVFSLMEATSEDVVAEANRLAEVPFDRILEARTVAPATGERRST